MLAGPPNAGKSSLFNALLGRRRALVADVPGTTRDYVEAELSLGRHGAVLVDTAGLRSGAEAIEAAGIELSREQVEQADVVLWVEGADAEPIERPAFGTVVITVETKRDLGVRRPDALGVVLGEAPEGIEAVRGALKGWFGEDRDRAWIGLARHRARAEETLEALDRVGEQFEMGDALELAAFELGVAEGRLGAITGRTQLGPVGDELMTRIFSTFCIGK